MIRTRSWHEKSRSPSSVDNPVYNFMRAYRTAWITQSSLQNAYFLGICSSTSAPLLIVVWTDFLEFFTHSWEHRPVIIRIAAAGAPAASDKRLNIHSPKGFLSKRAQTIGPERDSPSGKKHRLTGGPDKMKEEKMEETVMQRTTDQVAFSALTFFGIR